MGTDRTDRKIARLYRRADTLAGRGDKWLALAAQAERRGAFRRAEGHRARALKHYDAADEVWTAAHDLELAG